MPAVQDIDVGHSFEINYTVNQNHSLTSLTIAIAEAGLNGRGLVYDLRDNDLSPGFHSLVVSVATGDTTGRNGFLNDGAPELHRLQKVLIANAQITNWTAQVNTPTTRICGITFENILLLRPYAVRA